MTLRPKDPKAALQRNQEWRERSVERYQDKLRERARAGELKGLERGSELADKNPERIKKLRAKQFGTDGKREWIVSMPCCVSGESAGFWPIDPAHTGSPDPDERGQSTRAAGADSTYMAPLLRPVHTHYDDLPDEKFTAIYGVSKQMVREHALSLDLKWKEMTATATEAEA